MSPYVDAERIAESEQAFRDGLPSLREAYAEMDRDVLMATALLRMKELTADQVAQVAVLASVLLVGEEGVSAKTLDNWDAMSEERAEREAERDHLRTQLRERDAEVSELADQVAVFVTKLAEAQAEVRGLVR